MLPPQPVPVKGWKGNDQKYYSDVQKRMKGWRDIRKEYMRRYHETRFNTHHKTEKPYEVGDQVLVVRPREKRTKLSLHYDGPFSVKKRLSGQDGRDGNVYVLVDDDGNEIMKPAVDLKGFLPPIYEEATDQTIERGWVETLKDDRADDAIPSRQKSWADDLIPFEEFELFYGDDDDDEFRGNEGRTRRRGYRPMRLDLDEEEGLPRPPPPPPFTPPSSTPLSPFHF